MTEAEAMAVTVAMILMVVMPTAAAALIARLASCAHDEGQRADAASKDGCEVEDSAA